MEQSQKKFYNPCLASYVTKDTSQWQTTTGEKNTEIIDGSEKGNYNNYNAASGSWSDDPILNMITLNCSIGGGLGNNADNAADVAHLVSIRWTKYLTYKDHIKCVP